MFKGDKYFELIKDIIPPKVMRVYRNWNFPLTYLTGLINKDFALLLTFSSASIFTSLRVLSDALLSRRLYNDALMVYDM
jgi:hypothetical protein